MQLPVAKNEKVASVKNWVRQILRFENDEFSCCTNPTLEKSLPVKKISIVISHILIEVEGVSLLHHCHMYST